MRVCCGHCKSTNTDEQMLDRLNSGHVMHPRFARAGAQHSPPPIDVENTAVMMTSYRSTTRANGQNCSFMKI
jgi:hypothetical protein